MGWCALCPRLRAVSVLRGYISPVDFIYDRYQSTPLRNFTVICQVLPTVFSLVGQFVAMKAQIETISGGAVNGNIGNCILAFIILIYESFGGLESVAMTDVVQAFILVFSFLCLPVRCFVAVKIRCC
jgi:Na+/proline symporter